MADVRAVVPAEVMIRFPRSDDGELSAGTYDVTVTLESLGLSEYEDRPGFDGTQVIHASMIAPFVEGSFDGDPVVFEELAVQLATDFYRYRLANVAAVWTGAAPWELEGLSDWVEWSYRRGEVSLRVEPPAWNQPAVDWGTGPAGPPGPDFNLTVSETQDPGESFDQINLIYVDSLDGFVLSQNEPNTVRVSLTDFLPAGPDARHGLVPTPTQEGPTDPPRVLAETGDWVPPGGFDLTVEADGTSLSNIDTIIFAEEDAFRIEDEGPASVRVRFDVFKPYALGEAAGKQGAVPAPDGEASIPPKVLAETGGWVTQGAAPPPYSLTVGSDDVSCTDVTDVVFTTTDAFVVECGAQARVKLRDFSPTRHGLVPQPPSAVPQAPPLVLAETGQWVPPGGAFNLTVSETADPGESFSGITTIYFDSQWFAIEQNQQSAVRVMLKGYTGSVYLHRPACESGLLKVYRTILTFVEGSLQDVGDEEHAYDAGCCQCPEEVETACGPALKTTLAMRAYLEGGSLGEDYQPLIYNWDLGSWEGDVRFNPAWPVLHVSFKCSDGLWQASLSGCTTGGPNAPSGNISYDPLSITFIWNGLTGTCYNNELSPGLDIHITVLDAPAA